MPSTEPTKDQKTEMSTTSQEGDYDVEKTISVSSNKDMSEVEQIAERIEQRRENRVRTTFKARVRFLKDCRKIHRKGEYDEACIHKQDLLEYRDQVYEELESGSGFFNNPFSHGLGIKSDIQCLARTVDRAVELMESGSTGDWLYYKDFAFDYTRVVSRWPHMRHPLGVAGLVVFCYYALTPVLFCVIMPSANICDSGDTWNGIVSSLYFASTTISTVGYGDLTVDQDPWYHSFVGALYMLVSMVIAVVAFGAVADSTFSPLEKPFEKLMQRFKPHDEKDLFLYQRLAKIKFVKLFELTLEIVTFIAIGVFGTRVVIFLDDDPAEGTDWNWMTSFYWAVQTATTIGYGDLSQPESLRYFKIFYLMISTVLVGNALGKLGALRDELRMVRRQHAWDSRPVTKRMIDEMQAYDHDDKVDQYEFLVSSLISLGQLSSEEIKPIMDKFREHAGDKGYIAIDDTIQEESTDMEELEDDVIDVEM